MNSPLRPPFAHAAAASSGALMVLALPGWGAWPLACVAWVPWLRALRGQPPQVGLALGLHVGCVTAGGAFYWLLPTLERYSGQGPAVAGFLFLVFVVLHATRFGLVGWLATRAARHGHPFAPAFFFAFATGELVVPALFPWHVGVALHGLLPLSQCADALGAIGLSAVSVAFNLAAFEALRALEIRSERGARGRAALAWLALPGAAALYGGLRLAELERAQQGAPTARVGIVQGNLPLLAKRSDYELGVERHVALSQQLLRQEPHLDLIVWSETAVAYPLEREVVRGERAVPFAARLGVPLLFGASLSEPPEGGALPQARSSPAHVLPALRYNSALATDAQGRVLERYDKQRLLPFAEYMPLGRWWPELYAWSHHTGRHVAGRASDALVVAGHRIQVSVCYEALFPLPVAIDATDAPELLVNLTNDAWFGDTAEPEAHLALASLRAIEHRRFLVRAANSGISAVVEPSGRIVRRTATFEATAFAHEIAWLRAVPPFERWGNAPWWLGAAFVAWQALRPRRSQPRSIDRG